MKRRHIMPLMRATCSESVHSAADTRIRGWSRTPLALPGCGDRGTLPPRRLHVSSSTLRARGKRSFTPPRTIVSSATVVNSLACCPPERHSLPSFVSGRGIRRACGAILKVPPAHRIRNSAHSRGTSISPPFLPKGGCLGTKRKRLPRRVSGVFLLAHRYRSARAVRFGQTQYPTSLWSINANFASPP